MLFTLLRICRVIIKWNVIAFVIFTMPTLNCCRRAKQDPFKLGIGMVNITPPIGYTHYSGVSTGVKDTLYTKALVFEQGNMRGALLICDIIGIPRDLSRIVREQVSKNTGIPFQNISISATHTHTGPRFSIQEYADREAAGALTTVDQESYISYLIHGMIEAISKASDHLQEVNMIAGIGHAPGISFNRRYLMTDGRVLFNPRNLNPKIVSPVGPVDPDVHFVLFRPVNDTTFIASLTVFASHYSRETTEYSADYPFYLQQNLREIFGEQIVSVFGAGPCGDINTNDRRGPKDDAQVRVEKVGEKLAEVIKESLPDGKQMQSRLGISSKTIFLPLQDYTDEELIWAKEGSGQLYPERPFMVDRRRRKILSLEQIRQQEAIPPSVSGNPWMLPVEIHVFRLNDQTAIVTMPGEVFVELGLDLKERSPFTNTMVIELANIGISYVPTLRAFAEGDYEALNSRLAPGSGEKMIDTAIQMLEELK